MPIAYWLAVLTGLSYGAQGVYSKYLAGRFPSQVLAWATFTFAVPLLAAYLGLQGFPEVHWQAFLPAIGASAAINLMAWNLFFKALAMAPIYLTLPFTAVTPMFMIPVAWLLLGELPGWLGGLGIGLIILGAYGLHADSASFLQPFRNLFQNRGSRLMLGVALLWSVSATVEKVAVVNSSPAFYALAIHLSLSLGYYPQMRRLGWRVSAVPSKQKVQLFLLGVLSGVLALVQFSALQYLLASYVIAFKRSGIVFAVLFGWLFLGEKKPAKNLFLSVLMVLGAVFIMLD